MRASCTWHYLKRSNGWAEKHNFLKKAGTLGKELPPRNKFPALTDETNVSSLINGSSGWVIYSVETKISEANGTLNVDERVIELQ